MLLFSKRLKETRKKAGLTQKELGDKIGVTKVSICCYEKGTRTPTLDTLMDLADILGVSFTYLLGNEEYAVTKNEDKSGINLASDEIKIIKALRKYPEIYDRLLSDTERTLNLINKKIR